eukprot:EG_transcript_12187
MEQTAERRRASWAQQLPAVLWERVSDFLGPSALNLVCSRLWVALRGRHAVLAAAPSSGGRLGRPDFQRLLPHREAVRSLHLKCGGVDVVWLPQLSRLPHLEVFRLTMGGGSARAPEWVAAVAAALVPLRRLTHVTVAGEMLVDETALLRALATFARLRALATLELNLLQCGVTDAGVQHLARLGASPSLTHLRLGLELNHLGPAGVAALVPLASAPALRHLDLSLWHGPITDDGLTVLLGLQQAPLHTLRLDLSGTRLSPAALTRLAELRAAPALTALTLRLHDLRWTAAGLRGLAALGDSPALRRLTLDLSGSGCGDEGAEALAAFRGAPRLTRLALELRHCGIGDAGATALGALLEAPALQCLSLDLRHNGLGNATTPAPLAALLARRDPTGPELHLAASPQRK